MALIIAATQIFIYFDVGFLTGFGRSPFSFTFFGILINVIFLTSSLTAKEWSRAYLVKSGRKKPIIALSLITILFTIIENPIFIILDLFKSGTPLVIVEYLGGTFLPTLSENILTTYLAFIGGPIAALSYRAPIEAFEWFSPILPDLNWGYRALLGVMVPMVSYIYINHSVSPLQTPGIDTHNKRKLRISILAKRKERASVVGWTVTSIIGILMIWFSTGLLGVYPTVPISGSMRPTLDVGDLTFVVETPPEKIQIGDIIQFWNGEKMILHRVVDLNSEGIRTFITKGDANPDPDSDPVTESQIRGKVVYSLPEIGWASIHMKTWFSQGATYIVENTRVMYGAVSLVLASSILYVLRRMKIGSAFWRAIGGG